MKKVKSTLKRSAPRDLVFTIKLSRGATALSLYSDLGQVFRTAVYKGPSLILKFIEKGE